MKAKSILLLLTMLVPCLQAMTAEQKRQQIFAQLYSKANYTLNTLPNQVTGGPLALLHSLNVDGEALHHVVGSFSSRPGEGTRVILHSVPFRGDGIAELYNRQLFSGYRWFWLEVNGRVASTIQGGFYDLSAFTLPTQTNYTYDNHIWNFSWVNPTATDYGTRVSIKVSDREEQFIRSDEGLAVYKGTGTAATAILAAQPGTIIHVAFFGHYIAGAQEIDSGGGVNYYGTDAGTVQPIGGVYQSEFPDKLRVLHRIKVPVIQRTDRNVYRVIPPNAPDPVDQNGNFLPWPETHSHFTLYGKNFEPAFHKVAQDNVDQVNGEVIDFRTDRIHVTLPSSTLAITEPCKDLVLKVASTRDNGLESNEVKIRVVNANYTYARLCGL